MRAEADCVVYCRYTLGVLAVNPRKRMQGVFWTAFRVGETWAGALGKT